MEDLVTVSPLRRLNPREDQESEGRVTPLLQSFEAPHMNFEECDEEEFELDAKDTQVCVHVCVWPVCTTRWVS